MGSFAEQIGNVDQCRDVEDRRDIESCQACLLLQFPQSACTTRLVRLDVPPGCAPTELTMANEDCVSTSGVEHPSRGTHVASGGHCADVTVMIEPGKKLCQDLVSRQTALDLFVEMRPSTGDIWCRVRVGHRESKERDRWNLVGTQSSLGRITPG